MTGGLNLWSIWVWSIWVRPWKKRGPQGDGPTRGRAHKAGPQGDGPTRGRA